ncbi:hypothetical protein [Nitrosococcus watsonii]|uniref:hypothetical protein n=1 Tax=Nitrosococcus watsonii TaxID=473531 RepID=UPI0018E013CD|nr:hypothetical protein [Nitrosococcus watsonii]
MLKKVINGQKEKAYQQCRPRQDNEDVAANYPDNSRYYWFGNVYQYVVSLAVGLLDYDIWPNY